METSFRTGLRLVVAGAVLASVIAVASPASSVPGPAVMCKVKNRDTGIILQSADGSALQTQIDNADDGNYLIIRNVCTGNFTVSDTEGLQLVGSPTTQTAQATLDGNSAGTVLVVDDGASVRVKNLKITNGLGNYDAAGNMTGGGVVITGGSLVTMNGNTLITGNTADFGAGIQMWLSSALDMRGAAMVTGNTANVDGGGIMFDCDGETQGLTPANVTGNTPNDTAVECW